MGWMTSKEHRTNRRVAADMPVRFRVADETGRFGELHRTKTTNISCQGVAFETDVPIAITARLHLEILLLGKTKKELRTEATVVRIARELPGEEGAEYGIQFDMATLSDRSALDEYVRSIDMVPLLEVMVQRGATDLHLSPYTPPVLRVHKELVPAESEVLSPERVESLVFGILNLERRQILREKKDLSFALVIPEVGRWRTNVYYQRGFVEATFHTFNPTIPSIAELGLPDVVRSLALGKGGLVLVTGGAGCGKTTTLAAMVAVINHESKRVVVIMEEIIEYIHDNINSVIKQRELGSDMLSIAQGLQSALRQDPDVIVVDNIPGVEAMDVLLRAVETGRLVLASLPAPDAERSINRIATMYPPEQRGSILHNLAGVLRGIISQVLLPTIDRRGVAMAAEVLPFNDSIRSAIRMDRLDQIRNLMRSVSGVQLMDACLRDLFLRGVVEFGTALDVARDPDGLRRHLTE